MGEDGGQGEGMEEEVGEGKEVGLSKNAMKRKRKMERMLIRKRERKMEEKRKKRIEVERRLKEREVCAFSVLRKGGGRVYEGKRVALCMFFCLSVLRSGERKQGLLNGLEKKFCRRSCH